MKINWSQLTPEERNEAVCKAAGIPSLSWVDSSYPNTEVVDRIIFPKVSTDANEALKISDLMAYGFNLGRHGRGASQRLWVASFGTISHWGPDMCESICIAALRNLGYEVSLTSDSAT